MPVRKRLLCLLLVLILSLGPALPALAAGEASGGEEPSTGRVLVRFSPEADGEALCRALDALPGVALLYRYQQLFSGAAVTAQAEDLGAIAALDGVEGVSPTHLRARPQAISRPLTDSNSLPMMGAGGLAEQGLNGDGTVIAVIDSGLRTTHQAFRDYGLAQNPAIGPGDVASFREAGGTPGKYLSPRIPFAFDYCGQDDDVRTPDSHGTHVAALAAGYARDGDGAVVFRGAAPAAQLLILKVFSDRGTSYGADDADILKAMEDAWALGADVINLSLGVDSGFAQDPFLDGAYCAAFQALRDAGILLCCAAGNAAVSTAARADGPGLPTGDYTDYGTLSSPASYPGTTAVAAAEAAVYQASGYLQAGGRQMGFSQAVNESGAGVPQLLELAERELTYRSIPGAGRAGDYAGRDVRGALVLVDRGEIPFAEKVLHAAAAGAAGCLIVNNEPGTILPSVDDAPIPCAAITQADGAFLRELAGEDGAGSCRVSGGAYLARREGTPQMLSASSWGSAPGLRLAPALTAPGGRILSASAQGDDLYEQLDGTSMASPNAAGALAVALQALRQRGVEDRAEAAGLAEALLLSTARILTDGSGLPLSPRRQGAGLADLSQALTAPAVITDPLLELGDSVSGRFTLSFLVRSLSGEAQTFSLNTRTLTDGWTRIGETAYSALAPLDLTEAVRLTGPETVSVPAGETVEVSLTLSLDGARRQELLEVFPNGFYLEGFLTLSGDHGTDLHATFLGYCGDWEAAPILEPVDFRAVQDVTAQLAETAGPEGEGSLLDAGYTYRNVLPLNLGANLVYLSDYGRQSEGRPLLGQNPGLTAPHDDRYNAISGTGSDAVHAPGLLFTTEVFTLRNARRILMAVSDQRTGALCHITDVPFCTRSLLDPYTGEVGPACSFFWDGLDAQGRPLPDGTALTVSFYAWTEDAKAMEERYAQAERDPSRPESYRSLLTAAGRYKQWSFPLTVDASAPQIQIQPGSAPGTVDITLSDSRYLASAQVTDPEGAVLAEAFFADRQPGQTHTLTVELPEGETPGRLYISASDYAANTSGWSLDLSAGETGAAALCAVALLTDVDREAWYHEAVDYVFLEGLMEGSAPLTFQPDESATRSHVISALFALADSPAGPEEGGEAAPLPFTDAKNIDEYWDALVWAYENGLATGYSDTLFAAYAAVQRQQLAVLLHRFAALDGDAPAPADPAALAAFPDAGSVSSWAEEAVAWAVEQGLLSGREGRLAPRETLTRAELAQVLLNFSLLP